MLLAEEDERRTELVPAEGDDVVGRELDVDVGRLPDRRDSSIESVGIPAPCGLFAVFAELLKEGSALVLEGALRFACAATLFLAVDGLGVLPRGLHFGAPFERARLGANEIRAMWARIAHSARRWRSFSSRTRSGSTSFSNRCQYASRTFASAGFGSSFDQRA